MKDAAIVWFRNDLRIHDNEALTKAIADADHVMPIYVFDERIFKGSTQFGFKKTSVFRAKFIIDSVINLKEKLSKAGLNLLVRVGKPEEVIFEMASNLKSRWIFANRERTSEEVLVQDALESKLWTIGQEISYTRGKMLFYTSDLPFPITHTPDSFTSFRKEVEKLIPIRKPLPSPEFNYCQLPDIDIDWGEIPTLADFGLDDSPLNEDATNFKGGEDQGLKQLRYYLWDTDNIENYKETRNELLGWDFSTKFSAYLAHGCLSPKLIYHEVKRYEKERTKNSSTYWVVFELLWRDYFRLIGKKYGDDIFKQSGPKQSNKNWDDNRKLFNQWANGTTGIPFVDANMIELNTTGFMSNRGRQVVASFLVNDLKLDWRLGAEYFESLLIDYDPCSNYGNWNYISGIGTDPREDRYFDVISQAKRYDEKGDYVKYWLPQLKQLSSDLIHTPFNISKSDLNMYGIKLGQDYPQAIFVLDSWKNY